jgi:hypothetical protein
MQQISWLRKQQQLEPDMYTDMHCCPLWSCCCWQGGLHLWALPAQAVVWSVLRTLLCDLVG